MHETLQLAVEPPPLPESESSYGFARLPLATSGWFMVHSGYDVYITPLAPLMVMVKHEH